jgi:uncharacterized Fe-S radical SAM superfamily protein PflX
MDPETESDKFGDNPVKPTSFYSREHDKTKLNWFCYELALNFCLAIRRKVGKKLEKSYAIREENIADFSIYFAKKMKEIILQKLSGEIETVYFSFDLVEAYFPYLSDKLINKLLDVLEEAWDELLSVCEICPTRCVSEKDEYCTMFDEVPY